MMNTHPVSSCAIHASSLFLLLVETDSMYWRSFLTPFNNIEEHFFQILFFATEVGDLHTAGYQQAHQLVFRRVFVRHTHLPGGLFTLLPGIDPGDPGLLLDIGVSALRIAPKGY